MRNGQKVSTARTPQPRQRWRAKMTRLVLAVLLTAFAVGSAAAQAPGTCESKAIGKNGRELAGAARTAFLNKCKREACAPKAVGSDGKRLRGAAKNSFMAKCVREQAYGASLCADRRGRKSAAPVCGRASRQWYCPVAATGFNLPSSARGSRDNPQSPAPDRIAGRNQARRAHAKYRRRWKRDRACRGNSTRVRSRCRRAEDACG